MATTIGSLIAELGLDDSRFKTQLNQAKTLGLQTARDIEDQFKGVTGGKNEFGVSANVDDEQLTALNEHLDLKAQHFKQVQEGFVRSPLRPEVDFTELNNLEDALLSLQARSAMVLGVSSSQARAQRAVGSGIASPTPTNDSLVLSNQALTAAIGDLGKTLAVTNKTNEDLPVKISKSIYVSSKETLLDKIFNLPARVMESVVTGALEGVGQQVSFDFTKGALGYVENKTGQSASTLGRDFGRFGYNRGRQALMVGADALGYRGGLQELAEDISDFTDVVDKALDPKVWVKKANEIESLVVGALEDVRVYNDPQKAQKRVGAYFSGEFDGLRTGVNRVAGVGVRAAAAPFRINKKVQLAQSMELSKLLAKSMVVPDIEDIAEKKAIALLAGGVDLAEGGTNTYFAKNIVEKALGPSVTTIPVPNAYSNSSEFGRGGDLKKILADFLADVTGNEELRKKGEAIPLDRLLNISTETGFNPDAILMDATRRAYENKYGKDKRFIFAGTSAGTIAAEEATAIAERGGAKNVKGFGATLPMAGLTNTASNENFRAFVGNLDPMAMAMFGEQYVNIDELTRAQKKIVEGSKLKGLPDVTGLLSPSRNTEMVPGTGEAHHLGQFMANPEVKKRLGQFLDLELSTEYEGKPGTAAFKQYANMFGQFEALTRTLRMLEGDASAFSEEAAGAYSFVTPDLKLRRTYGSAQEKADLEYAAEEYVTSKRVKGVAAEDSEAFRTLMQNLIKVVQEGPELPEVDELVKEMGRLFGEAPKFDQALYSDIQGLTKGASAQDIFEEEDADLEGPSAVKPSFRKRRTKTPHSQYRPENLTRTPPVLKAPDPEKVLSTGGEVQSTGGELAKSFLDGVGEGLTNVAETAGAAMVDSAEKGAVNLINRLMRRVPGDPDAIDVTAPLIDKLSDIGPEQIAKASALGVQDAAGVLGKLAKAGASAAIALSQVTKSVGVSLKNAQPPANAFVGDARKRLGAAKDLLSDVKGGLSTGALSGDSIRGLKMLSGTDDAEGYISRMLADVEAAIEAIPANERTKPLLGNQLANLKSQIAKIEKQLTEVVSKLDPAMLEAGSTPLLLSEPSRTLNLSEAPGSRVKQLTAAQPPPNYRAQVKKLGLSFSDQLKSARSAEDPQEQARLARGLLESADLARQAISELLENLGEGADEGLKNLASAARQRITKSVKGATKLTEGVSVGENVGAGVNEGLRDSITAVQKSARDLSQAAIDSAEDTLGIQSPSKVFRKIGQYSVEGFRQGLSGFAGTFADIYQMADLYQDNLRKAFDASVISQEVRIAVGDLRELGSALGRIANLPNESIINQYKADVRSNAHLAKSSQGMGMHAAGKNIPQDAKQVVFVSSGFTGTRGRISNEISGKLEKMAPKGAHMVPFESKFDVSGTMDEVGISKVVRDAILEPMKAVKKGYNSEAMRLAKQAYSVKQQRPDADIKFVGHSAGGFVVREAQEILKSVGVISEALSMATPLLGAFQAIKSDAVSLMGEFDQVRPFSGQKEAVVPGVGGHFSPEYLDKSNEMRELLTQYLEEGISPALIKKIQELGKAIKGLEGGGSGGLMRFDRARAGKGSSVGSNLGAGFAQGIAGSSQLIVESTTELAEEAISAAENALEISSPSKVFARIGQYIAEGLASGISKGKTKVGPALEGLKKQAVQGFKDVVIGPESETAVPQFKPFKVDGRRPEQDIPIIGDAFSLMLDSFESMKNAATFIPKLGRSLSQVFEGLMQNTGLLLSMAKGAVAFNFVIKPLLGAMASFESEAFSVAVGLDNMGRMITFVSGTAREGGRNIDFIRDKVSELGGDLNTAMSGFGQLAASAQGTRLEGEGTRQLFGAISQASAVYQLDPQQQDRAFTATSQMLDKTVVSAEELRGQLSEALPSSLGVAARAMGTTTQEMGQMMSTGQILAEDLLPKFAQQLSAETSAGLAGSAGSAQSAINMLNNEVLFLQEAVGKTSIPIRVTGIKAAATGMKLLRENMEVIAPVMTAVFVTLLKNAIVNAVRFLAQFAPLQPLLKGIAVQGKKLFVTLLAGMKTFALQFARTFILIQGVTDLLNIFKKALGDTSGGMKDLAEVSSSGWKDYAESVKKAAEAQETLNKSTGRFKAPSGGSKNEGTVSTLTDGESLLEQTFLGSLLPKEVSRFLERGVQKNSFVLNRTFEDVKAENQTLALGDLLSAGGNSTSEAIRLLSGGSYATEDGRGSFTQVNQLDARMRDLQQQRTALAPGDSKGRRAIEDEINDLLKQRQGLYAPIGKIQRNLTQDIENYKDALQIVEDELARAGLSDSRRDQLKGQAAVIEAEMGLAQRQLDKINATIGESVNKITMLGRELRGVAAALESARLSDQLRAGQQNTQLAQARANGATSGEVNYTSTLLQREQTQQQLATNNVAIQGFTNTLSDSAYVKALENAGLSAEATSAEIKAAIENLADGSLKTTLETVGEFKGQLEGLQLESVGLEEQMYQAQAEASEQIREANREITEYYREVVSQAYDLESQVVETAAQADFNETKNALKSAMSGLSGSFFDDWIGGFMGFLESIQEIIQARIDADRQRMEAEQQRMAQLSQIQQMQRSLPGVVPGVGGSGPGAFSSPLQGQSVQDLLNYNPSKEIGQDFHALRDGGARIHRGIDIDSRAGGGLGGQVMASLGGTAHIYDINEQAGDIANSVGIAIESQLANGVPVEIRYNHLNLDDVRRDLGAGIGDSLQVASGQGLGTVVNHHLDYKVLVNGEHVNPQEFMSAMVNGGGVASTVDGRSIQIVAASPTPGPAAPVNTSPVQAPAGLSARGQENYSLLLQPEMQAFLATIRHGEGTAGADGYNTMFSGRQFSDLSRHPDQVITSGGYSSSAAGAYQFLTPTWDQVSNELSLPDFGKLSQDVAAVELIRDRGALDAVMAGDLTNALNLVAHEWASMPTLAGVSAYDQPVKSHAELQQVYNQALGGVSQGGAPRVTPGFNPIGNLNQGQFDTTQQLAQQNFAVESGLIDQLEQQRIRMAQVEADLQLRGLINRGVEQQRSLADQGTGLARQTQDRNVEALPQGSELRSNTESILGDVRSTADELTGINRQLEDSGTELATARESLALAYAEREKLAEQVAAGNLSAADANLSGVDQVIAQYEQIIAETESLDTALRAVREGEMGARSNSILQGLNQQLADLETSGMNVDPVTRATTELRREIDLLSTSSKKAADDLRASLLSEGMQPEAVEEIVRAFDLVNQASLRNATEEVDRLTRSLEVAQEASLIQIRTEGLAEFTRVLNRSGQGGQAREINFEHQLRQIQNEMDSRLLEIDEDTSLTSEQKDVARSDIRSLAENRTENARYDFSVQSRQEGFDSRRRLLDGEQSILGAQQSQADLLGFGGYLPLQEQDMQLQLDTQQLNFEEELAQLEALRDTTGMTVEEFDQLVHAAERTNQISMDNIRTQFSDLPEIVGAIKQPMTDALSSWIQGTATFNEAFGSMLQNILGNIVNMLANKAVEGLLGGLLGGGGGLGGNSGGGGGFGGGLLSIFGGLFGGGFRDGGKIEFMSGGPLRGGDPIGEALRKEGPGARIIVANDTEWVLNPKHQEILRQYGVDEDVLGFKDGGPIGGRQFTSGTAVAGSSSGDVSVNIPITLNGGSEDDGRDLAQRLTEPVRALIKNEVAKMRKPGGQLRPRR